MREFVVTLRSGRQVAVRADRLVEGDSGKTLLVLDAPDKTTASFGGHGEIVAVFDRDQLAWAVARDQLVSDEPPQAGVLVVGRDDDIPF